MLSELKVRSARDGDLLRGRNPAALAESMVSAGIAGLSIVTAAEDFGGSLDLVRKVRTHVAVPILRKDFTASEADIDETRAAGADAILLTVCLLDDESLATLHDTAHACGLETLVETHSRDDLERVSRLRLRPDLLGINNRDITVLETDDGDVSVTEQLSAFLPSGQLVLSESAISGADDARRARDAGADAVLVGTSILKADDPREAIEALVAVGWD
ncbi:MAG: indole-3-glycerol-phosphate synthase [Gaiella sp.]|nr:indole-3-glycerol-phosphate synthase [Gaiella sp.]